MVCDNEYPTKCGTKVHQKSETCFQSVDLYFEENNSLGSQEEKDRNMMHLPKHEKKKFRKKVEHVSISRYFRTTVVGNQQ